MKKRGYQFSFSWIFAIIIGAFILFFAIYATTQIINLKKFEEETKAGAKIGSLLNPVTTDLEQAISATIIVPDKTTIYNECAPSTFSQPFGFQEISTSVRQGNFDPDDEVGGGAPSTFHDRYLFSNSSLTSKKEFYVLSKPLKFPFKIADLIIIWGDEEKYCFVNPPSLIEKDIDDLDLEITKEMSNPSVCPSQSNKVCFNIDTICDINVNTNSMSVTHIGHPPVYYAESINSNTDPYPLLYAAIFSNPKTYECQVGRLMDRAKFLAETYKETVEHHSQSSSRSCGTAPLSELTDYTTAINNYVDSRYLKDVMVQKAEDVDGNNPGSCRFY
jgi:hypothetical protein